MRKLFVSLITTAMFLVVGCSNTKNSPTEQESPKQESTEDTGVSEGSASSDEQSLDKNLPTVVDFSATWCGPCRQFAPIFEQVEKDYAGRLNFVSIDIDEHQDLMAKYNIEAVPTIIFFDTKGNEVDRIVGGPSKGYFLSKVEELLKTQQ